jgi:glycosyltransferase involved in cell wall biosynthesis
MSVSFSAGDERNSATYDLVMTLLVRNEEDIISANIEYHRARGVDFFIVMDNLSIDRTAEILHAYQDKGLVRYILQEEDNFDQGKWVTSMARMAYVEYGAKWVINNDADEFWWPLHNESLRDALLELPDHYNIVEAHRHNFIPVVETTSVFYERMIHRETLSLSPLGEPLPPKMCHCGLEKVTVGQGNHFVHGFETAGVCRDLIEILHFPFRTLQQYTRKIITGGQAYQRNTHPEPGMGASWRRLYQHYRSHGNLPEQTLNQIRDPSRIAEGLRQGSLVEDRRMKDYMAQLGLEIEGSLR